MQIKSYNRAVDPNTINGQVRAPADINAYGGNVSGQRTLMEGLDAVSKQWQSYVDDQINMSVLDAKNKYEAGMNDLLNNPQTGLLNKQDINALDVVKQYQEGEAKIRQDVLAGLPNYRKARDAFLNMANDVNTRTTGTVMKYQYTKDMEHRNNTFSTFIDNETDAIVQSGNYDNIFSLFNRITASAYSLYGNIYGKDMLDAEIKKQNTNAANRILNNMVASGIAANYDKATTLLEKISPFVDDSQLTTLRKMLLTRKHDNDMVNIAKEIAKIKDPKEREKAARKYQYQTKVFGGANTGNNTVNMFVDAANEQGVDPRTFLSIGMVETGGRTIEGMNMAAGGGYGQITDGTAKDYKLDKLYPGWDTDQRQNIRASAYIFKKKIEENGGDVWKGVAGYNGGGDPEYVSKVRESYDSLNGYDLTGGNGAQSFENNLIAGFQAAKDIPENGPNGCAESALQALAYANPWAAYAYNQGLFNVEAMSNAAEAAGIQKVAYDPNNLSVGDLVIYRTDEGDYGHTVIYDGRGGFYGNSSSANNGAGGKVHGSDINIPGMTPEYILKTGAGSAVGMRVEQVQIYDESEIQRILSLADGYIAQEEAAVKFANNALFEQGQMEMHQLWKSGITDPQQYLGIAEKYGADNPDVYKSLKSLISTYAKVSTGSGGGSGGQKTNQMVVLKSLLGTNGIETFNDLVNYCNTHGIELSASNLESLQKAAQDYQNGTGEYAPMYDVTADMIEKASGIDKATFEGNMPVIKQLIRGEAVKYRRNNNGEEPPLDQLIQFGVDAITKNSEGYSEAQLRSAGIQSVDWNAGPGYAKVTDWNNQTYTINIWDVQRILASQTTLKAVLAGDSGSPAASSNNTGTSSSNVIDTISEVAGEALNPLEASGRAFYTAMYGNE